MGGDDLVMEKVGEAGPRLLFIEPYLTPSHRNFNRGLMAHVPARWTMLGLPGRFFRWRMRGAAACLALEAAEVLNAGYDALVCSEMLGLAELKGLVPGLARLPSLVVFHENQLAFPTPGAADDRQQRRDLFLAWSNLSTALAADRVVFNSRFHRDEVLGAARDILAGLPDAVPSGLVEDIAAKSLVLPVPIDPGEAEGLAREPREGPLRLVWNHRWEHDKDPEALFAALEELAATGADFRAAVIGVRAARWPKVFDRAADTLGSRLAHLGPVPDRREYWRWLLWADVAVSTARQEYFGLAVAEAVAAGCRPCLPDALVYPYLYPAECLYPPGGLAAALAPLAADPAVVRGRDWRPLAADFTWTAQAPAWRAAIEEVIHAAVRP